MEVQTAHRNGRPAAAFQCVLVPHIVPWTWLSFGLRLMERGERLTQSVYARLKEQYPQLADVLLDEQRHETEILGLIEEERIAYAGSVVLGLNDALVELTGALAG